MADTAAGRTKSVAADLDDASAQLARVKKDHPELADDPSFTAIGSQVDDASGRADDIATATKQGSTTLSKINAKLNGKDDLAAKVDQAKTDITDLNDGAQAVSTGAAQLHTGIGTADDGAGTLAAGARSLHTGLTTLAGGNEDLHTKLAAAVKRIPALTAGQQDKAVQVLSSPADVTTTIDNPATFDGRGLAPLFFAIALWVFGISVFLVVRPIGVLASVGGLLMVATV